MEQKRRNFIKTTALAGIGFGIIGNVSSLFARNSSKRIINIGIIGHDTSHVIAFTEMINHSGRTEFKDFVVVAAYPTKGSVDLSDSIDRLDKFTEEIREMGVEIVNSMSVPELA